MMEFKNLSFLYGDEKYGGVKALDNINLKIERHEYLGLIGHTGSGKSTLVQHMNALNIPSSGSLTVDGMDTSDKNTDLRKLRQKVGLVFQYPEDQLFEETVFKDIAFGPKNLGLKTEEIEERVFWAMDSVGLDRGLKDVSPFALSGGQKRRVAIAGVLALKPLYLVLDEPTAGLDPRGRRDILSCLDRLYRDNEDMTIILVTHSMEDIADHASRIVVIAGGKIEMDAGPYEIFKRQEELEKLGLSVPQVTALINKLRGRGLDIKGDIIKVDEAFTAIYEYFKEGKKEASNE